MALDTDRSCPRCGAARAADQRYCLQCGLALPAAAGRIPSLRRRWISRFGWYPGDWVWAALPMLLVAIAGAAAAIAVSDHRSAGRPGYETVAAAVPVREPAARVPVTTPGAASTRIDTANLPTAPEPPTQAEANGKTVWPPNENGWTIVLVSYPKTFGHSQALAAAAKAAKKHLNEVGVIDSSSYPSLQPGYYVVFAGIFASKADADASVATARQAGFAGAYSREIAG